MPGKAVLVTGGAGFIGSHACMHLAQQGYLPVTLDNLSTGFRDAVRWGPFHLGDVRDISAVRAAIDEHGVKTVMHFAASAYVGESVAEPAKYYGNNVGGMLSLLKACEDTGVQRFVLSSSCAVYGTPSRLPITEDTECAPINPYGRTKLVCEWMLGDFSAVSRMRYVALRYFNACGADPGGALAERHNPETHLVPLVLMAASGRRPAIDIFGTDYDTPDGTCIRDYIHVQDLARGHMAALRHLESGSDSLTVNLGSGQGYSILEIIGCVERTLECSVPVRRKARRPGDPPVLYADTRRAADMLGFRAERSDLATIIRDAAPTFGLEPAREEHA